MSVPSKYAYVDQLKKKIKIKMFYQSYSNILIKLRQPAVFEPNDVRRSNIPKKKDLNSGR